MLPVSKLRVTFIDWLRGLAAIIMLQGHTFDAFLRPADRAGAWFTFSQFFGGEAAAIFLFLTGATYGMGMNRREHMPPRSARFAGAEAGAVSVYPGDSVPAAGLDLRVGTAVRGRTY